MSAVSESREEAFRMLLTHQMSWALYKIEQSGLYFEDLELAFKNHRVWCDPAVHQKLLDEVKKVFPVRGSFELPEGKRATDRWSTLAYRLEGKQLAYEDVQHILSQDKAFWIETQDAQGRCYALVQKQLDESRNQ